MAVLKGFIVFIVLLITSATIIITIPGIPPDIEFEAFHIESPKPVLGWFKTNTILDEAEIYFESSVGGIESVAVLDDNAVFTGDQSGTVFKITKKHFAEKITQLKYPCGIDSTAFIEAKGKRKECGWPLGMRFDNDGNLLIMDYFGGLTKVDVKSGSYENLIPKSRPIQDKIGYVPEDVHVAKDGSIYWTDGSTNGDFFVEMLGQPSGRLLRYDPVKRTNEVLLENLHFSNGISLSDNEDYVLVVECGTSSIKRYYIDGEKKGQSDTFVSGLPGYPDNIRSNGRGGYYVGLTAPWTEQYSMRIHQLAPRPLLRKLILRSRHILLTTIKYIKTIIPDSIYLNEIEQYITVNGPIMNFHHIPKTATIVELSKNGEIIGVLNAKSGKLHSISQITLGKIYAYLNSPFDNKVWRIKLDALRKIQ